MAKRFLLIAAIGVTLLAAVPFISVIVAGTTANALGYRLDEASVYPCIFLGTDIGSLLSFMFIIGWLMLATAPILAAAFLGWLVFGIIQIIRIVRRRYQP